MNTYYVSSVRGDDATGAGTALSPWKTISKAIGNNASVSLGATGARVYIEPGTYYEAVVLGLTPSAATPLEILGDCDGAGFLAGGYSTPTTGVVDWSAWFSDSTYRSSPCIDGGTKSHVSLSRLKMHGGSVAAAVGSCVHATTGKSWTIVDSIIVPFPGGDGVVFGTSAAPATAGLSLTIDRCDFHLVGRNGVMITAAETAAEYSLQSVIRNCRSWGGTSVRLASGSTTGLGCLGTGLTIEHCSFLLSTAGSGNVTIYDGITIPLASPIVLRSTILFGTSGVRAGHLSHVAEDWNVFFTQYNRVNVSNGANSSVSIRPVIDREDGRLVGTPLRPMGEPTPGSRLGGFVGSGTSPDTDLMRRARPEGFQSIRFAAGALERHDTGEINTPLADTGSPGCLALRGPSSLERPILVDSTAVAISVKVRWDGNHGDARKPQAVLFANPEIGITADQVVTASSTGGTGNTPNGYETLSFSTITPTRPGALMLRLISRSATGTGVAYFDSITLS